MPGGLTVDKKEAKAMLAEGIVRLSELQERLYAEGRWSVLIVLQAMDAAGKDSIIKHVMSGINPQGCEVHSFKQPSAEELKHDFLWRVAQRLPTNGRIGIFNRSHYEEVPDCACAQYCWTVTVLPCLLRVKTSGSSVSKTSALSSVISPAAAH